MTTEAPAKKTHATRTRKSTKSKKTGYTEDQRLSMIAEAAYYLAEQRGFEGSAEAATHDWLSAEQEINKSIGAVA